MKQLKALSRFIQHSKSSFVRHNAELSNEVALEKERLVGTERLKKDLINSPDFRVKDILSKNQNIRTAVDIGSGAGWASAAVAKLVPAVIALEPSEAGILISKKLYSQLEYPNISWQQGFAEELLPTLVLTTPTIFITGCVLSHLRDQEVEKICQAIVAIAPKDSVFAFSECWSEEIPWHQHMWHVRTKAWWQAQFGGWTLEFGGLKHDQGDYHMGIWGVKL
jgi:SAM-dependent methyltransferase